MKHAIPDAVRARLVARYGESHRHYHTWSHVLACLDARERIAPFAPIEVDVALWFHDVIYDPRAHDNEERSAALMLEELGDSAKPAVPLVLATKHSAVPDTEEARIVVDADLSILGADMETFDTYEQAVRQEYAFVPDDAFRAGRAHVLRSFLDRPTIFSTPAGRDLWEHPARENLARSLAALDRSDPNVRPR
jgi:predicted metal-dependent HD superfamily phosphohydrolase